MDIIIYGKEGCNSCRLAKNYLDSLAIKYTYQDINVPGFDRNWLRQFANGQTTVPVISIDGQFIGGYERLSVWFSMRDSDIKLLKECLAKGQTMTVKFKKSDGTIRVMHCTTNPEFIPSDKMPVKPVNNSANKDPDLFVVFDVQKQEWRSFRAENIIKVA